uniref:Ribose-phosphate pyrophosphokinase n=1 Tax=Pseudomonas phage RVTF4 TaxID=3236931 RepID=A0AB39CC65_9VIRU
MIYIRESYFGGAQSRIAEMVKMPGGELHPQLGELDGDSYTLIADTRSSEDLFAILVTHNAIKRNCPGAVIDLRIGYVPYARQDRVANEGEALSIEAMADFLNMMNFRKVEISDPHSDVTPALIKNVKVRTQVEILRKWLVHVDQGGESGYQSFKINPTEWVLVAPDAGAIKKTDKIAKELGFSGIVYMDKERDTQTGKITRTFPRLYVENGKHTPVSEIAGKKLLVVDDICDGGYTFIQLADALKEFAPEKLDLFVTHGIFSKGTDCLLEAGYNRILTTNAYRLDSWNVDQFLGSSKDVEEVEASRVIRFRDIQSI